MQIEKVLQVHNPTQFYKILIDKNWMTGGVDEFLKSYFRWQYGCPCDSEKLWNQVEEEYKELSDRDLSGLIKKLDCDKIEFINGNN